MSNNTYIVHLADIHIGSSPNRSAEYRAVFDSLHEKIVAIKPAVIVIAGDIFHFKTRYSGADVDDFYYLIAGFCATPVVIIPGNHDGSIADPSAVDLIAPLVVGRPNLHYLRETTAATIAGIEFYHVSQYDPCEYSTPDQTLALTNAVKGKVLLYHGQVAGAKFGQFIVRKSRMTTTIMGSAKMVLLGDIHEHQYIGGLTQSAYCGSLIQQTVAESLVKGFIVWRVETARSKFVPVPNVCGKVRLDVRGLNADQVTALVANTTLPDKITKLTIITDAENPADQVAQLETAYNRPIDSISRAYAIHTPSVDDIEEALVEIISDSADFEQCNYICGHYANWINVEQRRWHLRKLSWSNLYKYGPDISSIDFTNLVGGISGVIAPNRAGKSTIIDIAVLALYGECLRGDKSTIRNTGAKSGYCSATFDVRGKSYTITRIDHARHAIVTLTQTNADGTSTILTGATVDATYKTMRSLIGPLPTLLATGVYYDQRDDITRMGRAECMRVLPELLGLSDNTALIKQLKDQVNALKKQLQALNKPRGSTSDLRAQLTLCTAQLDSARTRLDLIQSDTNQQARTRRDQLVSELTSYKKQYQALVVPSADIIKTAALDVPALTNTDNLKTQYRALNIERNKLDTADDLGDDLDAVLSHIHTDPHLKTDFVLSVNGKCDTCLANVSSLSKYNATSISYEELKKDTLLISRVAKAKVARAAKRNIDAQLEPIISAIRAAEANSTLAQSIELARTSIAEYKTRADEVLLLIDKAERELSECAEVPDIETLTTIGTEYGRLQSAHKLIQSELELATIYDAQAPPIERKIETLKIYIGAIGSTGLRLALVRKYIAHVTRACNDILAQITDFTLETNCTDTGLEFYVCSNINNSTSKLPLSLGSGFQRFIIAITFRLALTSMLPAAPQFIIIDEGFGCMDAANVAGVATMLSFVAAHYDFVFIISHIDALQSAISIPLGITIDKHGRSTCSDGNATPANVIPVVEEPAVSADQKLCSCGAVVKKSSYYAHVKTAKHLAALNARK